MSIDKFSFVEHFDYMKRFIPQPFFISTNEVKEIVREDDGTECNYIIKTTKHKYTLSRASLNKLVDALGVKSKLLYAVCDETDVLDLVLPIVNKLFKCYSDCFVFYANPDDALSIIELNVNNVKGEEGTRYEDGPSPWKIDIAKHPEMFTCFASFLEKMQISESDKDIYVRADETMPIAPKVVFSLFKEISGARMQPMLTLSSKFSNMNGFSEIYISAYDDQSKFTISFPMNLMKIESDDTSFSSFWNKAIKFSEHINLDGYIFSEINELASSNETPTSVKNFISDIMINSDLNLNQPIKNILEDSVNLISQMRENKAKKFKRQLGSLIGYAICMKHIGCTTCGHMDMHIK